MIAVLGGLGRVVALALGVAVGACVTVAFLPLIAVATALEFAAGRPRKGFRC